MHKNEQVSISADPAFDGQKKYIGLPNRFSGGELKIEIKEILHHVKSDFQEITFVDTQEFGRCMIIDGIMQTAEKDHHLYDQEILKKMKDTDRNILVLGGGDGYVAELALKSNPNVTVRMVEIDMEVIAGCKKYLDQKVFTDKRLELIIGDAFAYLEREGVEESFDGIVCDFTGEPITEDQRAEFEEFFTKVLNLSKKALKSGGWMALQAGDSKVEEKYVDGSKILQGLTEKEFKNVERSDIMIPSYGEDDSFLFGEKE
jgi:spermidine synthase